MTPISITLALASIIFTCSTAAAQTAEGEKIVVPLNSNTLPTTLVQNHSTARVDSTSNVRGLHVQFHVTDWPNVFFKPAYAPWDWAGYTGLAIDVFNPEAEAQTVNVRVDNAGADGVANCNQQSTSVPPGKWTTFRMRFNLGGDRSLWGMRGLPVTGPMGGGAVLDLTKIVAFQVFLAKPGREHNLVLNNFRLYGPGSKTDAVVKYPFVDPYGQYRNAEWPGKLKSAAELKSRAAVEHRRLQPYLAADPTNPYCGWKEGPRVKSTGWFRTERIDGKWWLVTPDGHLFFSAGLDCINTDEYTFIEGRDRWFEWLPDADSPMASFIQYQQGAHSMADPIGGKGKIFSFYSANLYRRSGKDWRNQWSENAVARMRSWGFNTIGNWSDGNLMQSAKMPFVGTGGISGDVRRIEGGGGYWGKMVDVYDPAFEESVNRSLGAAAAQFSANPYCIGYFSDNEIAWEAVERGALASPVDQPCRVAEIAMLKQIYGESIERLNGAWETQAASWETLRAPDMPNATAQKDLSAFVYQFAKRYFEVCKQAYRKAAPHQLYLGCRFASAPKPAVRACADVADIVSFNIYQSGVNRTEWTGANDLNKPILIGEFHFGALGRGMFHEGLGPRATQKDRAAAYTSYVRSVADCPAFVGCHWFQYVDEPLTGRWFDGENYNIGMVDVTDTPYLELTAAATRVHGEVYARHATSK